MLMVGLRESASAVDPTVKRQGRSEFGMSTRIREYRKLRGMTLQFLAQKVGTTAQTIQRLETGNMTVSLDWLQRIAEVFGMPAAALLVSDNTASVPVIGELDGAGRVIAPATADPLTMLSLVVAMPDPIAVRVMATITTFDAGTVLICNKLEFDQDILLEARACLVGLTDGTTHFGLITCNSAGVSFNRLHGAAEQLAPKINWVAPVMMAIRYFD